MRSALLFYFTLTLLFYSTESQYNYVTLAPGQIAVDCTDTKRPLRPSEKSQFCTTTEQGSIGLTWEVKDTACCGSDAVTTGDCCWTSYKQLWYYPDKTPCYNYLPRTECTCKRGTNCWGPEAALLNRLSELKEFGKKNPLTDTAQQAYCKALVGEFIGGTDKPCGTT